MRCVRRAAALAVLLGVSGCVPLFLHPGYTAGDEVVESRLFGTWVQPAATGGAAGGADTLSFRADGDRACRIVFRNGGHDPDSMVFLGHVFRLGTATLVDAEPHPANTVFAFYVPAHAFLRVRFAGDTLVWGGLAESWTADAGRRSGIGCPVDTVDTSGDRKVLLTCATPGVRRLLAEAVADPKAFWSESMVRQGAGPGR